MLRTADDLSGGCLDVLSLRSPTRGPCFQSGMTSYHVSCMLNTHYISILHVLHIYIYIMFCMTYELSARPSP